MKLKKSIQLPSGTMIPAGTELHFSNEGLGYYNGQEVLQKNIPTHAIAMPAIERASLKQLPIEWTWGDSGWNASKPIFKSAPVYKATELNKDLGKKYEPWMHAAVFGYAQSTGNTERFGSISKQGPSFKSVDNKEDAMAFLAVWTWDTRKLVELMPLTTKDYAKISKNLQSYYGGNAPMKANPTEYSSANDNGKPIDGLDIDAIMSKAKENRKKLRIKATKEEHHNKL